MRHPPDINLGGINKSYTTGTTEEVELDVSALDTEKITLVLMHEAGNDLAFASKEHPSKKGPKLVIAYKGSVNTAVIEPEEEPVEEEQDTELPQYDELKAFPTAYGAGAYASGGRGGQVIHVTNLNDSGPGSFRAAVTASGPRIVVFDVSGTIENLSTLAITNGDLTIAGQTAPAGGITITGYRTQFSGCNNLIVRFLRFRPVFRTTERDAVSVGSCTNYIFDHISVSWGTDEIISMETDVNNATFQRMLIAEGNKTASLLGNSDDPARSENFSMHDCLFYNISHRFPNVNSNGRVDVINNVVYNWRLRLVNALGGISLNHLNNYYMRGSLSDTNLKLNKYNGNLEG